MSRLQDVLLQGTHAARPAAAAGNTSYFYFETDTQILFQSNGSSWVQVAAGAGVSSYTLPDATTSAIGGVKIDQAPGSGSPIAVTTPRIGAASGVASLDANSHVLQQPIDDATEAATNDTLGSSSTIVNNLNRIRYQLAQLGTGAWNSLRAMVQLTPSSQQSGAINVSGEIQGSDFKPGGVTGATAAARYHAATASGHPTTGTWAVGDIVPDQTGTLWMCTTAGTPGTWTQIAGGGGGSSPLTTKGDLYGFSTVDARVPVGTDGYALVADSTQSTGLNYKALGAVQPNTKVQLNYKEATITFNGSSISSGVWTDITTQQNFIVDDPSSVVEFSWYGGGSAKTASNCGQMIRCLVDGVEQGPRSYCHSNNNEETELFVGQGPFFLTGLSAGSHTIKLQYQSVDTTSTLYYRGGSEVAYITVLERKQSSSPPSSTPAPAVRCYNSANISVSSGVTTTLTFDSTEYDQGTSSAQHSTSANTSRLTCQQDGTYYISADVSFASNSTGVRGAFIYKNGTDYIATARVQASSGDFTDVNVSAIVQLTVGDYIELQVNQASGGALNVMHAAKYSPYFMMARIDTGGTGAVYVPQVKTSNYTAVATDSMIVAGANSLVITLPAASAYTGKPPFVVKNDNFTSTTVSRAGSDLIDGATTYSLASAYGVVNLVSDGNATWRVI